MSLYHGRSGHPSPAHRVHLIHPRKEFTRSDGDIDQKQPQGLSLSWNCSHSSLTVSIVAYPIDSFAHAGIDLLGDAAGMGGHYQ